MPKVSLIIQARIGSKRLPGKTLMPLAGKPLIYRIIERVKKCKAINNLILAIPDSEENKKISKINFNCDLKIFLGSENNLVERYYLAAKKYNTKIVVRLPGDNCMPEAKEIDRIINFYKEFKNPFFASNLSNILDNQYPDGIGAEVFGFNYLDDLMSMRLTNKQKEHIHINFFDYTKNKPINPDWCKVRTVMCPKSFRRPDICLDVNTINEYKFIKNIYDSIYYTNPNFGIKDIIKFLDKKK
jgi:spore coat polysaccharide biosynthesis protein SpsF